MGLTGEVSGCQHSGKNNTLKSEKKRNDKHCWSTDSWKLYGSLWFSNMRCIYVVLDKKSFPSMEKQILEPV